MTTGAGWPFSSSSELCVALRCVVSRSHCVLPPCVLHTSMPHALWRLSEQRWTVGTLLIVASFSF